MSVQMHRMAAIMAFTERKGCTGEEAALASFALHPLDDSPAPGRQFEKQARKLSRSFARRSKSLHGKTLAQEARTTLNQIKALAKQYGETHYVTRYDKALAVE